MPRVAGTSGTGPATGSAPGRGGPQEAALRIGLSLPGGIAPGTFEAGAVCGLLAWIQEANALHADTVLVDVIAGASAGALTGLLAARVLLAGDDPVAVYRQAWIAAPSLRALRGTGHRAPLSLRPARAVAQRLLFAPTQPESRSRQAVPVTLNIALGCLRGFTREIPSVPDPGQKLLFAEYLDWSSYELKGVPTDGGSEAEQWTRAIDSAIASASHPAAFRARVLDRNHFRNEYLASGVTNLPAHEADLRLWYTDGGLLDNEPLGRCVDVVSERDGAQLQSRLVMLVRSSGRWPPPPENRAWSGRGRPRWIQTLVRALDLIATQATGRDLLRVQEVNAQLRWTKNVATMIASRMDEDEQTRSHLQHLLADIEKQRTAFARMTRRPVAAAARNHRTMAELIEAVLKSASGLTGKQCVEVAVAPLGDASPDRSAQAFNGLLAFIERPQREDHFAAGYWAMMRWIEDAQTLKNRVPPDLISNAVLAAGRKVREPSPGRIARDRSRGMSFRTRTELIRLGLRTGLIARADLDALADRRASSAKHARDSRGAKRFAIVRRSTARHRWH